MDPHDDDFFMYYQTIKQEVVKWYPEKSSNKVNVSGAANNLNEKSDQHFSSNIGKIKYDMPTTFRADEFHFHMHSEHTIEGQQYDFEMHVVHYPNVSDSGTVGGVIGIIFDQELYDKNTTDRQKAYIDEFFDTLYFNLTTDTAPHYIPFGEFMEVLNSDERFVYQGSLTTPPCAYKIYWNVLTTVYPISKKHYD